MADTKNGKADGKSGPEIDVDVQYVSAEDFLKQVASPDVTTEKHVKLEDGQGLKGKFMGWDQRWINDPTNGGKRLASVVAMEITHPTTKQTIIARMTATHELESQLDGVPPGSEITIMRIGKVAIGGGKSVTRYSVVKPKSVAKVYMARAPVKDGKLTLPPAPVAPALPGKTEA